MMEDLLKLLTNHKGSSGKQKHKKAVFVNLSTQKPLFQNSTNMAMQNFASVSAAHADITFDVGTIG